MAEVTWMNLFIVAAVATVVFLILGMIWRLFFRFIKIWAVFMIVLIGFKLASDAGWI